MFTQNKKEKKKLSNRSLRSFIVVCSLLEISGSYVDAGTRCIREDLGVTSELRRVMQRRLTITQDSETLVNANGGLLSLFTDSAKRRSNATRLLQEESRENVLEIQNENSKPLTITLLDQDSNLSTELGIIPARSTVRFLLDRDTLYDAYSVKGYLGLLRSDTCANLSFRNFYSKITFQSNTIGTTARLDRTADIY